MSTNSSRLAPLLDDVSDAVILAGRDGTILDASTGIRRLLGYDVPDIVGRTIFALCHPDDARRAEPTYRAAIDTPGQRASTTLLAEHANGSWRSLELTFRSALDDPILRAVIVTCHDASARPTIDDERQQRYTRFLSEMALEFARYQEPASLFPIVARRCTELLGEWCLILSIGSGNPPLHVEAVYHADPKKVRQLRDALDAFPLVADENVIEHILRDGRPFVVTRDDSDLDPGGTRRTAAFWQLGIEAVLAVPIYVAGQPFGVFSVATEGDRPWHDEQLELASLIADRVGAALHNARLIASERSARQAAERTADWSDRLQRATADLSEALTIAQVADVVLDHAVAALGAHAGSISLLNPTDDTLDLVAAVGYPETIMQAWHRLPFSRRPVSADAIRRRQPVFLDSRVTLEARYVTASPRIILPFDGARAIVPLLSRRDVLGVMSLSFPSTDPLSEDERALIVTLARQCAVALERARLYDREHGVAETLQRSLLPAQLPAVPGIQIAARYLPAAPDAKVGGDWYDALVLSDGRLGFAIGDVAGRGLPAASIMGRLRNTVRAYAIEAGAPDELVRRVGRLLERDEMVTLVYLILDPVAGTATYANAGHVPPLLVTPDGRAEFLPGVSIPLCRVHASLHAHTVAVPSGSKLILYTDGLIEDRGRRTIDEGFEQLRAVVTRHREAPADTLTEHIVSTLSKDSRRLDDVAVLVVSVNPIEAPEFVMRMRAVPESVLSVRRSLARWLTAARVDPERAQEIITAVGEACTNAVQHASESADDEFRVTAVRAAGRIDVTVQDEGRWRPPGTGRGGRGIILMNALMDAVEIDRRPSGTTVRLQRRLLGDAEG